MLCLLFFGGLILIRTTPHAVDLQAQQIRLYMRKSGSAKALDLLRLYTQHLDILPDNLAADRLQQPTDEAANFSEAEGNGCVDFRLVLAYRSALRHDDEVTVRTKVIIHTADIGHDETICMPQFFATREK